jgi:3',5'-cyclic AMP phosphodiesterase CpdA
VRTLVHLSDIHFGSVDRATVLPLIQTVRKIAPNVVVVSGDLTQRARTPEFVEARAFLDRLPGPKIVVPGNHDVPLYNPYGRFIEKLERYQRHITPDLEPSYVDEEIAVLGLNTARSSTWKGGRVNHRQIARVKERLCGLDSRVTRIVVTHHPFDLPQPISDSHLVGRARMAMGHLAECGADLLLAGHMHVGAVCRTVLRYQIAGHSALVVQAGTATSTRGRGELNSFNCIRIEPGEMTIERWSWSRETAGFAPACRERYRKTADGWEPSGTSQSP